LGKSPDAFRSISEVSQELDVPKYVLRFWETKFTHLKPMKLGGNRRYYRREDIDLLRGIRTLLHDEGYTIRGLQRLFREQGVNYVKQYGPAGPGHGAELGPAGGLPDLAGETAGHARQNALHHAQSGSKGKNRKSTSSSASPGQGKPARQSQSNKGSASLAARDRRVLEEALAELEQCRAVLAQPVDAYQT